MTDRELLELAAKAAGIDSEFDSDFSGMWLKGERSPDNSRYWNPLTDDGDALRLAVKLKMTPHIDGNMTDCEDCTEEHLDDPYAATRRAIVRAAAEIVKALK